MVLLLFQDAFCDFDFINGLKALWSWLRNKVRNTSSEKLTGRHCCKNSCSTPLIRVESAVQGGN